MLSECTCTERLVQVSRGGSVPALTELGSQLAVCCLFIVQHLQRLMEKMNGYSCHKRLTPLSRNSVCTNVHEGAQPWWLIT